VSDFPRKNSPIRSAELPRPPLPRRPRTRDWESWIIVAALLAAALWTLAQPADPHSTDPERVPVSYPHQ
jgi:hypothetical protein